MAARVRHRESTDDCRSSGRWWACGAFIRGSCGKGDESTGFLADGRRRTRRGRLARRRGLWRGRLLRGVALVDVVWQPRGDQDLAGASPTPYTRRTPTSPSSSRPSPSTDYWDKLPTQIASENEADIVAMQSQRMPGFAVRRRSSADRSRSSTRIPSFNFPDFFKLIEARALRTRVRLYALGVRSRPARSSTTTRTSSARPASSTPSAQEPMCWEEFKETAHEAHRSRRHVSTGTSRYPSSTGSSPGCGPTGATT